MYIQDCMLYKVASSYEYFNTIPRHQLLHLDPHADWQEGRRDFFATIDLTVLHRLTVKHRIICLCYILWNNTNAVRWIIMSQETSDSTAYDMWDRYNDWGLCLSEHTESHLLYHHFNGETRSGAYHKWEDTTSGTTSGWTSPLGCILAEWDMI